MPAQTSIAPGDVTDGGDTVEEMWMYVSVDHMAQRLIEGICWRES